MASANKSYTKILAILSAGDRRQFYWLIVVMLVMGILEVVGIGSVMPFIAALSNTDIFLENEYSRYIYDLLGFGSMESFVVFLGGTVLALLITRNIFFGLSNWLVSRFTFMWRHNISERLLHRYLMQSYTYFLSRNTLELKRKVCTETERVVSRIILPGIQVLTSSIVSLFIMSLLIAIDPLIALLVATSLGGGYLVLYALVFRKLNRLSKKADEARREKFKITGEAFEGVKELKLFGKEKVFVDSYSGWSRKNAVIEAMSRAISLVPKYGIEMLAVSGIMGFILYMTATQQDLAPWLPILVVYVISGYRLLPALQKIFSGLTTIIYNLPSLDALYNDFSSLPESASRQPLASGCKREIEHIETIELRDINFLYPDRTDYAIHDLNLTIENNTTVGLVGSTGSGKTTAVDIILGLLKPHTGELLVNGIAIASDNMADWQEHIGYVPQHIFLFDDTVARNIAFGVPESEIDFAALDNALKIANLYDFVSQSLPEGYNTMLGQRGIRLSGGQRQRIGIARALYHNPGVLVLDEATSALDNITERVVMDAIYKLSHKLTIIMIAHRLSSVRNCDVIHYIEEGHVVSSGSYADLSDSCEHFQKIVNL
jgi:ABC-type multidrug transport system fused ATPase/permease subunit